MSIKDQYIVLFEDVKDERKTFHCEFPNLSKNVSDRLFLHLDKEVLVRVSASLHHNTRYSDSLLLIVGIIVADILAVCAAIVETSMTIVAAVPRYPI